MFWFLISAGLAGLVLVTGAPLPLLTVLLLVVPGLAAGIVYLVRSQWREPARSESRTNS